MMGQYSIKKICFCLALSLIGAPLTLAMAATWSLDTSHSRIEFFGRSNTHGFQGSSQDIRGELSADLEGKRFDLPAAITMPVSGFKTGNDARDHAMQHMFEMEKHPDILWTVQKITPLEDGRYRLEGELKIHNVSRSIEMDVTVTVRDGGVEVTGQKDLTTEMFGMKAPVMLGVFRVQKEVRVAFKTYWTKKNG